jgi:polyhydroxyalkanoate synthesis regulator protein
MGTQESPLVIKRYAERRFYDAAGLRYVNLDDFARMVLARQRFVVCEAATGEDVTREVLDLLR